MSAINVIVQSHSAHMLTDGAAYQGGKIVAMVSKVWPAAHIPAIFAVRGPAWFAGSIIDRVVFGVEKWSNLKAEIADRLRVISSEFENGWAAAAPMLSSVGIRKSDIDTFEVVAIGYSDDGRFDAFMVGNHAHFSNEPFALRAIDVCAMLPGDLALERRFVSSLPEGASVDDFDPVRDGIRLMEMQRQAKLVPMGGFVQLTSLKIDGDISTRIIKRWPKSATAQSANQYEDDFERAWRDAEAIFLETEKASCRAK